MTICVQYSRPASGRNDSEIFGFDVAVTNLMAAYFRHSSASQFVCRPTDMESFDHFKMLAIANGVNAEERCIGIDPRHPEKNLQSISCLFRPDPLTVDLIWRRQQMKGHGYATCGLVHTMSGERIARAVGDLCLAPSDGSDALICPSTSVRDAVRSLWEIRSDYFNHRFGGRFTCPVQLPVIPLGIDTEYFTKITSPGRRAAQRSALDIQDEEIVILFVGRLSFATKAHPMALFLAAERAARRSGKKIRLILFGYFKPTDMEPFFRSLAQDVCQTVTVEFIKNDDARFPDGVWAAGDIFASLSDNVQESFGLTPIEAMASGLPCVVSDWNGYREGVRNGLDGFRVPTTTPPASAGMALAQSYYNEENYGIALTATGQSTSVDVEGCAHAFLALIQDKEMRRGFSESGKKRARETFDWKNIIPLYESLWNDLAEQRAGRSVHAALPENWQAMHPAFPNPWKMFESFPTTVLKASDMLHICATPEDVDMVLRHEMNYYVPELLLPKEKMLELIEVVRNAKTVHVDHLLCAFPHEYRDRVWRCIGWMLKFNICRFERPLL